MQRAINFLVNALKWPIAVTAVLILPGALTSMGPALTSVPGAPWLPTEGVCPLRSSHSGGALRNRLKTGQMARARLAQGGCVHSSAKVYNALPDAELA